MKTGINKTNPLGAVSVNGPVYSQTEAKKHIGCRITIREAKLLSIAHYLEQLFCRSLKKTYC
jgi:hypothetical protein